MHDYRKKQSMKKKYLACLYKKKFNIYSLFLIKDLSSRVRYLISNE